MSEALRLAQRLEILVTNEEDHQAAAAELRRLHALNAELVEALHQIRTHTLYSPTGAVHLIARAALAKVEKSK